VDKVIEEIKKSVKEASNEQAKSFFNGLLELAEKNNNYAVFKEKLKDRVCQEEDVSIVLQAYNLIENISKIE